MVKRRKKRRSRKKRKVRKVNYSTYQEVKQQRNIAIYLIPILVFSSIFLGVLLMKKVHITFTSEVDSSEFDSVQLYYLDGNSIQTLEPSSEEFTLTKTADLLFFRVIKNETATYNETTITNSFSRNFTRFQPNATNTFELNGSLEYNNTYYDKIGSRYYKYTHLKHYFNETYDKVINITYSIDVSVSNPNVATDIYIYDFITDALVLRNSDTNDHNFSEIIDTEALRYANDSSILVDQNRTNTYLYIEQDLDNQNFTSEIYVNISILFANYTGFTGIIDFDLVDISIDYELNVISEVEITINQFIFTSLVNFTQYFQLALYDRTFTESTNHTIIITENIVINNVEDDNLFLDSNLGLSQCNIVIKYFNLEDQYLDYEIEYGALFSGL